MSFKTPMTGADAVVQSLTSLVGFSVVFVADGNAGGGITALLR